VAPTPDGDFYEEAGVATGGRMPPEAAEKEWRVLAAANPKYEKVKVAQTCTNVFADEALKRFP